MQFGQSLDYPTVDVHVNRERAGLMGVKMADVSRSLVAATSSSRFVVADLLGRPEQRRRLSNPGADPAGGHELRSRRSKTFPVSHHDGQPVLLRNVANVTEGTAVGQYERYNMQRMITVTANISGADLGTRGANRLRGAIKELGAPPARVNVAVRGQVVPMQQMLDGLRDRTCCSRSS